MKSTRIVKAYDAINPTAEQKERMLQNILHEANFPEGVLRQTKHKEGKGPVVYTAKPTKTSKKSAVAAIAASLVMVAASAALLVQMAKQPEGPAYAASTETTVPAEETESPLEWMEELGPRTVRTGNSVYDVILDELYHFLYEIPGESYVFERSFSTRASMKTDREKIGWCLMDLDGNGQEELLISDGQIIYNCFSYDENGIYILPASTKNVVYHLCQDGIFSRTETTDRETIWSFANEAATPGTVKDLVILRDGEFYSGSTKAQARKVSTGKAEAILKRYTQQKIDVISLIDNRSGVEFTGCAPYDAILEKYDQAVKEGYTEVNFTALGLSPMIAEDRVHDELGWCTMDIDNNGQEELLIATMECIYDLYTISPDGIRQVVVSRAGNRHTLCRNGYLAVTQFQGDDLPWYRSYFKYDNDHLTEEEGISYVEVQSASGNYWQYYRGASSSSQLRQPVSKDEAARIMGEYVGQELFITRFRSAVEESNQPDMNMTGVESYDDILSRYYLAAEQGWNAENLQINYLPPQIAEDCVYGTLGWCLLDIDNNGQEELLIGDGERIYDSYTITASGELAPLMSAGFEKTVTLCQNGIFRAVYPNEGRTVYIYHKVTDAFTTPEKTVVYENGEYRAGQTEAHTQPVSKDEAGRIMGEYIEQELFVTRFLPKGEDVYDASATYAEVLQLYRKALTERWSPLECGASGLSMQLTDYYDSPGDIGYTFMNLDGGEEELLITNGSTILNLFTVKDGMVKQVFIGADRYTYWMLEDNQILHRKLTPTEEEYYIVYKLMHSNVAQEYGWMVEEAYVRKAADDPKSVWYFSPDGDAYGDPCGSFDAEKRITELMSSTQEIGFRRFN